MGNAPGADVPDPREAALYEALMRCLAGMEAARLEAAVFGTGPEAAREDLEYLCAWRGFPRLAFTEQLLEHWLYGRGALDYLQGHGCRHSDVRERIEGHFGG